MRLSTIERMPRQELLFLARLLAPAEVFPHEGRSTVELQETILAALGSMFSSEPLFLEELETFFFHRLSGLLGVPSHPENMQAWSDALFLALGERVLAEIQPVLEVLSLMGWADGILQPEEIEMYDAIFSTLKVLRPFRKKIISICTQSIPKATLMADLQTVTRHEQRAEQILAFAWIVAMIDEDMHALELSTFNEIGEMLGFSSEQREQIAQRTTLEFRRLRRQQPSMPMSEIALRASGVDSFVQRVAGLSFLPVLTRGRFSQAMDSSPTSQALHSLTLFSKMCILSGPEFTLDDRILLLLALLLTETD